MRVMASSLEQILSEHEVGNTSSCSYTAALNIPGPGWVTERARIGRNKKDVKTNMAKRAVVREKI